MICLQRTLLDIAALILAVLSSLRPSIGHLTPKRPGQWLFAHKYLTMLTVTTVLAACQYGLLCWYLTTQNWFSGGNGTSLKVRPFLASLPQMGCADVSLHSGHYQLM